MHPTIDEITRWRIGAAVRPDVQRRWQADLRALDAELTRLQGLVDQWTATKAAETPRPAPIAPKTAVTR